MPRQGTLTVNVDHVHDGAFALAQLRRRGLREEERRAQVRAHEIVPLLRRHAAERRRIERRCVVDERVHATERSDCAGHDARQRGEIEQIRADYDGRPRTLAVQLVAQRFRFADRLVTMDTDVGAVRMKAAGQRRADAPGRTRDQNGAAG
jgi:hypothetical protein